MITKDKETMVEQNLGLVHSCANRFRGRGIEYDDLFQAGCMGLVKATAAFDEGRGVMFSTYAVPVILGEIRRLFRDGGTVKVSRSIKELGVKAAPPGRLPRRWRPPRRRCPSLAARRRGEGRSICRWTRRRSCSPTSWP